MRLSLLPLLALPGIAAAQTPFHRRVEALGPAVPDGESYVPSLLDSGWALVQSDASKLVSPERYPEQLYFRSPEGALIRLPLEKVGFDARFGVLSRLSPDASFALVGSQYGDLFRVDRQTLAIRRYENVMAGGRLPIAISGRYAFLTASFTQGFFRLDLETEEIVQYPALAAAPFPAG